jgi:hypothetical protein
MRSDTAKRLCALAPAMGRGADFNLPRAGAAPLMWSTWRDSNYPVRCGSEDGRQTRQSVRDRSAIAPSRGATRP